MLSFRVIPTLLLRDGGLYKSVQFDKPKYVGDPINAVKIFNDKECDELIILDTQASVLNQEPDFDLIEEIASEAFMPFAYGGGVKNLDQIKRLLGLGAEKIVLNSVCYENPRLISEAAQEFGTQAIVACVDVKKNLFGRYQLFSHSGRTKQKVELGDWLTQLEKFGAGEIIIQSIDQDGRMQGYDCGLIKLASERVGVPVVALGGAGSIKDFEAAIMKGGASAVSAGSFFVFHGKHRAVLISYPGALALSSDTR